MCRRAGSLVVTKVDARGRDYSAARVRASVAESRDRLGMAALPLAHLHDPEYFDFDEITAPGGAVISSKSKYSGSCRCARGRAAMPSRSRLSATDARTRAAE